MYVILLYRVNVRISCNIIIAKSIALASIAIFLSIGNIGAALAQQFTMTPDLQNRLVNTSGIWNTFSCPNDPTKAFIVGSYETRTEFIERERIFCGIE